MTYQQTLDYLFAQLPMYQRIGKAAYKANLDNTWWLMEQLNAPHKKFKSIHVAGTNGKGSTSHLLASIFQEAGFKTGLYTSPHLVDFRERIRINGEMISEQSVIEFTQNYKDTFANQGLSFFEWTVGLAFDHFTKENIDIAIVEVGLGGRLDSTNVILPELSIITNIGYDHVQFLGNTLDKIAAEKAGIIKESIPVIIGKTQDETVTVFQSIANDKKAEIIFADQQEFDVIPSSPLLGNYQEENFKTVLIACKKLQQLGFKITTSNIQNGFQNVLKNTQLKGRWDIVQSDPRIICDVGHNKEGLIQNIRQLQSTTQGDLHFLLGFVNDKEIGEIFDLFPENAFYHLTQASVPRALPANELENYFFNKKASFKKYTDVADALANSVPQLKKNDTLYVGGSTFIVADFYNALL
jgi:dihydrofolate synthase / folylpolyglutamate synthase